jgi:hypothetical protein
LVPEEQALWLLGAVKTLGLDEQKVLGLELRLETL